MPDASKPSKRKLLSSVPRPAKRIVLDFDPPLSIAPGTSAIRLVQERPLTGRFPTCWLASAPPTSAEVCSSGSAAVGQPAHEPGYPGAPYRLVIWLPEHRTIAAAQQITLTRFHSSQHRAIRARLQRPFKPDCGTDHDKS